MDSETGRFPESEADQWADGYRRKQVDGQEPHGQEKGSGEDGFGYGFRHTSDVEAEMDHIAFLHDILFAFQSEQTLFACGSV